MSNKHLVNKDLILLDYEAKDKESLLKGMADILEGKEYVKETFFEGLIKREGVFPTGLKADGVEIAIPHTDPIHVNKPTIFFTRLKNPVTFKDMAGTGEDVNVKLVFMLVIKDPKAQVSMLSNLMGIFTQKEKLEVLYTSEDVEEIYNTLVEVVN